MKVAIDATVLRQGRVTGLERYTASLIGALLELESDHEWHVLLRAGYEPAWEPSQRLHLHRSPYPDRLRTDQVWLPRVITEIAPSAAHFPAFAPPWNVPKGIRVAWTIHDGVFWLYPKTLSLAGKLYYRPLVNRALGRRSFDVILTVSESAAADVRRRTSDRTPIFVTRNGLAASFRPRRRGPACVGSERFILAVGTAEPRKNLTRLVRAHSRLRSLDPKAPPLVIVGRTGWGHEALGEAAAVRRLEAVPDDDLASLYSHCAAFVLPSLYEGFGLPLLEAMACGAPCIASDIPALREVGGDACIYVAPDDLVGIAEALTTVLVDRRLAAQMRTAALARSSQFSWIDCARKTLDAYEALVDA